MALYYTDLAAIEEESSLCTLADLAVMFYEKEHSKSSSTNKTTFSEEDDKRIFLLFPRKSRNQRNPNTILVTSNPRNLLLQWPQSPKSSSTLLDSEKTEMTNPNSESSPSSCLTDNNTRRSRKRRAAKQRNPSNGKSSKKPKPGLSFTWKGKETPKWLLKLMKDMKGTELKLIFEKDLYKTDVEPGESRLSMPFNNLIRNDFLNPIESRIIEEDINNDNKTGVGAILVDRMFRKYGVMLKRWEMKKDTGRGSWNYSLTCGWNDVVKANGLKKDDYVSVWSFRWCEVLCFALVPALCV